MLWLKKSSNAVRVVKSRRMLWAGHVSRIRKTRNACSILKGKPLELILEKPRR
jgi:hypothetical protein